MRATLAVVLVGAGLALIQKADVGLSPAVVVATPVAIGVIAWLVRLVRQSDRAPVPEKV
jgi:hypothetical protein